MTFEEYVVIVSDTMREYPSWRSGQAYFNCLYDARPDLSEQIRGGMLDPFYDDSFIPQFLEFVMHNWDRKEEHV